MNMNQNTDKQNTKVTKKLKYGSLSAGFLVVVIVLCVALNLAASVFSARFDLRVDITDDEARYYTITPETKAYINNAYKNNPGWKVTFTFLAEEKAVSDLMVLELARSFESAYPDHISLRFMDKDADYERYKEYCNVTQVNLTARHVLVESDTHIRALNFDGFYDTEAGTGDVVAFSGQRLYASALVRVSMKEAPVAVFTAGHGESIDNGKLLLDKYVGLTSEQIMNVMVNKAPVPLFVSLNAMGFDIQVVDLNKVNALPDNTRLVIINDPQNDFLGYDFNNPENVSEMDILRNYMNSYNSSLLMSVDPDTEELPELSTFLWQEYGIGYEAQSTVIDMDRSIKGSNGTVLLGDLKSVKDGSLGAQIASAFIGNERFVFSNAVKLKISDDINIAGEDVLVSASPSAQVKGAANNYPLFAYGSHSRTLENEEGKDIERLEYQTAYLLGSTEFLSSDYLTASYSNRALFENMLRKVNTEQSAVMIDPIYFVTESLEITTGEARTWTVIVTVLAPLVIFTLAAVVWIKRRHA